jgi:hypothetical protein
MTGDQENRRRRIIHRFVQIALGPTALLLALASFGSNAAAFALLAVLAGRGFHYWQRARPWLGGRDRAFAAFIGLACDITYGFSFLGALVYWALKDPSIVRFGRPVPGGASRP